MRWIKVLLGIVAVVLGTIWVLFGTGYIAIKNVICFDICSETMEGPNQFWTVVGIFALLIGLVTVLRTTARPRIG